MDFEIQKASLQDYQSFADIIRQVWESLDHKEWFVADNAEYTYHMLSTGQGIGYKAVIQPASGCRPTVAQPQSPSQPQLTAPPGQALIAGVFMATIPGLDESNLGYDIGFPEDALLKVAHMDSVAVLPAYRGNHLQYRLMQAAEHDLKEQGFRYLLCTVHPENPYSRNNVLRQGYRFMVQKEKYGGYIRDLFLKEI